MQCLFGLAPSIVGALLIVTVARHHIQREPIITPPVEGNPSVGSGTGSGTKLLPGGGICVPDGRFGGEGHTDADPTGGKSGSI